jgi:tRNA(adenine34) deaminase
MEKIEFTDEYFMKQALTEAKKAFDADEVPIGAVIVCNKKIIARAHNLTERLCDGTAHAEMQAFTSASEYLGGKYLEECTLFVTLEPCMMCAGAAAWVRVGKVVYGVADNKHGCSRSRAKVFHPKTKVKKGVLADQCAEILKTYFKNKRIDNV